MMNRIMMQLGQLQAGVDLLREDVRDEKASAAESRAAVHRRLDDQARDLGEVKTDVALTRTKMDEIAKKHKDDVAPAVEDWKRMKTLGNGIVTVLMVGGLSAGAMIAWFSDQVVTAIRHWLKVS